MDKKYKIIKSLREDAPYKNIIYCTLSFISSDDLDNTKCLDVNAIKIYNGYADYDSADTDARNIRKNNSNHDIFIAKVGKIYPWNDLNKCDKTIYEKKELNKLEKTRKENQDKVEIIKQQLGEEFFIKKQSTMKLSNTQQRLRNKLHERGVISQQEYEECKMNIKKNNMEVTPEIQKEIDNTFNTDYLDENYGSAFKYALITIYDPEKIKGLDRKYFKVRGLFETQQQLLKRKRELEKIFPDDDIGRADIGFWSACKNDNLDELNIMKRLNYLMKLHIENIINEDKEYIERREKDIHNNIKDDEIKTNTRKKRKRRSKHKPKIYKEFSETDKKCIQEIYDFLYEPKLDGKYVTTNSTTTHEIKL